MNVLWMGSVMLGFAMGASQPTTAALDCDSSAVDERIVRPGAVLLLGEIHGTEQAPAAVAGLVCQALAADIEVIVGLEIPERGQADVDDYLASSEQDEAASRARLVEGAFWSRDYQDGRSSRGMLELLRTLRRYRAETGRVRVALIDDPRAPEGRDEHMADTIRDSAESATESFVVALVGNLHNRLVVGTRWNEDYEPMGYLLGSLPGLVSLRLTHSGGSAWICSGSEASDCGERELDGQDHLPGIMLFAPSAVNAYSGRFHLGPISASPPAKN